MKRNVICALPTPQLCALLSLRWTCPGRGRKGPRRSWQALLPVAEGFSLEFYFRSEVWYPLARPRSPVPSESITD